VARPRLLTAVYVCEDCDEETEGVWPAPEYQDDDMPEAVQECPCGHPQLVTYPGYSFRTEAG
jgi:DNA-directed RNA polymerase subunit RPC12/RpoP